MENGVWGALLKNSSSLTGGGILIQVLRILHLTYDGGSGLVKEGCSL